MEKKIALSHAYPSFNLKFLPLCPVVMFLKLFLKFEIPGILLLGGVSLWLGEVLFDLQQIKPRRNKSKRK